MRRKCEFISERDKDLFRAYKIAVHSGKHDNIIDCIKEAITLPASKFWISSENAARMMSRIDKGDNLENISPLRREMLFELYTRYQRYITDNRGSESISRICEVIIEEPAPRFYIGMQRAIKVIKKERTRRWKESIERLNKM